MKRYVSDSRISKTPRGMARFMMWLLVILGFIIAFAVIGCAIARKATYPAPQVEVSSPPPSPIEEITLNVGEEKVVSWLLRLESAAEDTPVCLALHGNGENLETMYRGETLAQLSALGVHVFAVDYPGYGRSTGSPNETSVVKATEQAFFELKSRFPSSPVVVWGWSLGAAVAAQVAVRNSEKIAGLILVSPWTSLPATAKLHYPSFLIALFMRDEYNTLKAARSISAPALVIHGERDELIPSIQGKAVADALPRLKRWCPIEGAGHNDVLTVEEAWEEMSRFIQSL